MKTCDVPEAKVNISEIKSYVNPGIQEKNRFKPGRLSFE